MKKLRLLIILLIFPSCTEDVPNPYWGCWTEATGKVGVYDILLEPGRFTLGGNCGSEAIASFDIGYFRNDTLILDNGAFEYWCYLKGDTLLYSEGSASIVERLVKI